MCECANASVYVSVCVRICACLCFCLCVHASLSGQLFSSRTDEIAVLRVFSEALVRNLVPESLTAQNLTHCALNEIMALKGEHHCTIVASLPLPMEKQNLRTVLFFFFFKGRHSNWAPTAFNSLTGLAVEVEMVTLSVLVQSWFRAGYSVDCGQDGLNVLISLQYVLMLLITQSKSF